MTDSTNNTNKAGRCRHTFWTWLIATILVIYMFWHWQHGHMSRHWQHGHGSAHAMSGPIVTSDAATTFSFAANSADGYRATGDAGNVAWAEKSADLSAWLKNGEDWQVTGDASNVTLTGTVDSEEMRLAKGAEAQAFFGESVSIDNQLTVNSADAASSHDVTSAPSTAKLYFDTGKTALPGDADHTLAATIAWLKANTNGKAIISGYSDSRGNQATNTELSKNRAKSVREILKAAGIDEARIEMRKPVSVEIGGDLAQARRVEVAVAEK